MEGRKEFEEGDQWHFSEGRLGGLSDYQVLRFHCSCSRSVYYKVIVILCVTLKIYLIKYPTNPLGLANNLLMECDTYRASLSFVTTSLTE